MAVIRIPGGSRGAQLAELIVQQNPGSRWRKVGGSIEIEGPRLEILGSMIAQVYWPDSPAAARAVERFMRHLIGFDPKAARQITSERIVIMDEPETEQPLLVRFPASLKERLARVAELLGISQNELVVRAVQDLVSFAEEISEEDRA